MEKDISNKCDLPKGIVCAIWSFQNDRTVELYFLLTAGFCEMSRAKVSWNVFKTSVVIENQLKKIQLQNPHLNLNSNNHIWLFNLTNLIIFISIYVKYLSQSDLFLFEQTVCLHLID